MSRALLRLRIGRSTLRAESVRRGTVTWTAEATYADVVELADAIARLAAEAPERCWRVAVRLERPPVQVRTLGDLPPVKSRELRALVAHQAGRFFRRNGHPLVTDATWLGEGPGRVAKVAAVEEPLVEAIAAGARAAGLWLETALGRSGRARAAPAIRAGEPGARGPGADAPARSRGGRDVARGRRAFSVPARMGAACC